MTSCVAYTTTKQSGPVEQESLASASYGREIEAKQDIATVRPDLEYSRSSKYMPAVETSIAARTSYEVLTKLDAVKRIASEWNVLLARSNCNFGFSSAQWFIA